MRQVEIPEINLSFNVPENLAECSSKEYLELSLFIMEYLANNISYEEFRIKSICKLLNITVTKKHIDDIEIHSNVYRYSELMSSFFEDTEHGQKKIKLDFVDIKIPKIRTFFKNYLGPQDMFSDITYGEYADVIRLFNQFNATGETNLLYLIAAIFYRPKQSIFKKEKERYDTKTIEKRASKFKKFLSSNFVYGVYLQFVAFQQYLPTAEIDWGNSIIDFSILFEPGEESETSNKKPGIGADSVVFTLAESGVFGNTEKVRETNFWEIMIHLYDLRKRDLENNQKK